LEHLHKVVRLGQHEPLALAIAAAMRRFGVRARERNQGL
jgi:hypothetical protein